MLFTKLQVSDKLADEQKYVHIDNSSSEVAECESPLENEGDTENEPQEDPYLSLDFGEFPSFIL